MLKEILLNASEEVNKLQEALIVANEETIKLNQQLTEAIRVLYQGEDEIETIWNIQLKSFIKFTSKPGGYNG